MYIINEDYITHCYQCHAVFTINKKEIDKIGFCKCPKCGGETYVQQELIEVKTLFKPQ